MKPRARRCRHPVKAHEVHWAGGDGMLVRWCTRCGSIKFYGESWRSPKRSIPAAGRKGAGRGR